MTVPSGINSGLRNLTDLPGPQGLPILGNTHQVDISKLHLTLERWAAQYGPAYLFRLGGRTVMAISEPTWCDQVLRSRPEGFARGSRIAPISIELGLDGVFTAEGEFWRRQRRLAVFALAQRNLRSNYAHLLTVASRLKRRWETLADDGSALDVVTELKRFTVDATTLVAFNYDINTIEQGNDVIQRQLEQVFPTFSRRLFASFPTWRVLRLPKDRRVDHAVAELRRWLAELIVKERSRLATDPLRADKPSNFLEAMLAARDDTGQAYSDDVVFANLMTMLLAGEDTTAHTLAWAIHHLCDSPDSFAGLRREADAILGLLDLPLNLDAANELAWTEAILNETMRLRPVAPIMMNHTLADTIVGDVRVPKGTQVAVLSRPAAVDAAKFEEPNSFRPERWLGSVFVHDVSAYIPFGSGPRVCPGRLLAFCEMKLILSMLGKNFDLERIGPSDAVSERFSFTMIPVGLKVRLRRRSYHCPV